MKTLKKLWKKHLKTIYANFVVLAMWYVLHIALKSSVIPSPFDTIKNFIIIFPNVLAPHLLVSLWRIAAAMVISLVLGIFIGIWTGINKKVDDFISPIVYILYPLPKVAFLPVLMILWGLGDLPKIILIIIIIIFQIILAARDGVKEIPKELFMSVKSLDLSRIDVYRHLILPAILPKIFTALRICIGVSIAVLFFAENFATTYGIGYFIMNSWSMVNYLEMFSGIVALGLLGLLLFKVLDLGESMLCKWTRI
ncbi:ABC transporter permease subunit [Proteiniborus sp. MB09-C3]|uniref:ABC transporter permease n=1 Tax=Proteiniborus sp. MB09-C3 TaxID=3050072 RepID=UPI00255543A7|nr:ABC transporter permease subunit [Proteiniborus sp. MB09-C3]WIV12385.1 ABC transporter permease subunit [Proteiniborus sp. MB09-C3]